MEAAEHEDVFHVDFTTASAMEIFIAKIEEIFHDWELPRRTNDVLVGKGDYNQGNWLTQTEKLKLVDPEFVFERDIELKLTRHTLDCLSSDSVEEIQESGCSSLVERDLVSFDNDFCRICLPPASGPHPLTRWYGIRDFIVLSPQSAYDVDSESKIKSLLSCLQIAVDNSECGVPVFLQCGEPWQMLFQGLCRTSKYAICFDMVHLERTPSHCKHLNGLVALFKSKVGNCKYNSPLNMAIRFTYIKKEWAPGTWLSRPEPSGGEFLTFSEFQTLPFGPRCEPISELLLSTVWPKLMDQTVVDGEMYSDLEPRNAPIWQATITTMDDLSCLLSDHYTEFMMLTRQESKMMLVPRALSGLRGIRAPNANPDDSIPSDVLMVLLYYLFPDADENAVSPSYFEPSKSDSKVKADEKHLKGVKSVPFDSLPWRLAVVMLHTVHSLGGIRAAEQLWYEFAQELVYRCDHNIPIPGEGAQSESQKDRYLPRALTIHWYLHYGMTPSYARLRSQSQDTLERGHRTLTSLVAYLPNLLESGYPGPRSCLLYQKLQLLNCCIARRIDRDKRDRRTADDTDSEPEEFYDADEETTESKQKPAKNLEQPTGRLSKHGDLLLLETGEPLYVPKTQDPVPHTEDQLEEHADILLQLGTDGAASALRASLMSASLLADMEAFKAANPGCTLADFIRWFSPRDWIENDDGGELSSRMNIPGNLWQEVWSVAKPVPARNQRRLFDDTKEMEKALQFIEVQTPKEFATLLLPVVTSCVLSRLIEETAEISLTGVQETLERLIKKAEVCSRMTAVVPKNFEELLKDIVQFEKRLVHYKAIYDGMSKLIDAGADRAELKAFVSSLVLQDNVVVPNSAIKDVLHKLLSTPASDTDSVSPLSTENNRPRFPAPNEKEIILKAITSRGSQRLFAVIKKNEFRLCGAFSEMDILVN